MKSKQRQGWKWAASLLLVAAAAWLLWRQLRGISFAQLFAALQSLPPLAIVASVLATALSFACLAAYERMATQWLAPGEVPRAVAWRIGLVAHALGNTLGFHAITAVALRLRTYAAHGIDAAGLAKIVAAIGGCVATGVIAVLGAAGAWTLWRSGGGAILLFLLSAAVLAAFVLQQRLRQMQLRSPMLAHAGASVLVGLVEMAAAIAALAVLLPPGALPGGPSFVLLFVGAMLLGIASHAPGGLGVFEATMLAAAAPAARAQVLAALLAYRAIYNLLPCALALSAVAADWWRARQPLSSTVDRRA